MPAEKRVDPDDGVAYTYDELAAYYKGKYKKADIAAYWETCKPVKKAKGKGKGAPEPKAKAKVKAKVKAKATVKKVRDLTIGYHLIRGLGAPLRMMCYFANQKFTNEAYGADMKEKWFGETKPELLKKNSCINLPYILDGDHVITQSNTCLLYLGRILRIDRPKDFSHNHCVLDQVMDLRNELMKVVYPGNGVNDKEGFPEAAKKHLSGAKTHFTKLEGFCKGTYMCGSSPQSGDFHVFEMLDQHQDIAKSVDAGDIFEGNPKLKALYDAFKASDKLKKYWEADCYKSYAQNNGLFTHFTGQGSDFVYGPTVSEKLPAE